MTPSLLHPLFLAAIATLLLNDHLLKAHFPGVVTGKLSDLAGLTFFPVFLHTLLRVAWKAAGRWSLWACVGATVLGFALVKTVPAATIFAEGILEVFQSPLRGRGVSVRIVTDPTDLVALPLATVCLWLGRRR